MHQQVATLIWLWILIAPLLGESIASFLAMPN